MPNKNQLGMISGIVNDGLNAIGTVGSILGIGQGKQDRRQIEQQKKLQELQIKGQKELADYQQAQQMDMWNKTNYEAQMEHIKNAGLNPALLYGMSGGGGATTGAGIAGSISGGDAANAAQTTQANTGMGMMLAQMKLIDAQTKKTEAEAKKIEGVDTEKTTTEIANLTQGIENAKAQQELTKVQTELNSIEAKIKGKSAEDQIDYIHWQTEKAINEVNNIARENYIGSQTVESKINEIKNYGIQVALQNLLITANTSNTNTDTQLKSTQVKQIAETLAQKWKEIELQTRSLDQKDKDIKINQFKEEVKASYPAIWDSLGKGLDAVLQKLTPNSYNRNNKSVN